MATTPTPVPAAPAPVNHFERIFGALFSPKKTFEQIAQRPTWIAPIVLLTIISFGFSVLLSQKVNWGQVVAQSLDQSPRTAQMTPEQRARAVSLGAKVARVQVYVFGVIGSLLGAVIFAAIFLGAFNLLAGAGVGFGTAMGIVSHAFLPTSISGILGIIVTSLKSAEAIDPQHLLATSLAAVLSSDAPKWLSRLAGSVDIFWLWIMFLIATGFAAASPRKVSTGKALGICYGIYFAFWLLLAGWAAV